MKLLLVSIFTLFSFLSFAQTFPVSGTIADSTTREGLPGASVVLIRLPDSVRVGAATDVQGSFTLGPVQPGRYLLEVTYISYETVRRRVRVADQPVNLGNLFIRESATQLKEVQVVGRLAASQQKGDTTQFNASSFKTSKDASAEDLIQKMPGVTMENGQVKTEGENVTRVTVDGKQFFGDDAAATLRNLPAEVIDKIQVFNDQSDQAKFTGFDDGTSTKAINIVTRQDKRNGRFGRLYGGIGNDGRYQGGGVINQFDGDRRLTVLGQFNNINQQNFSSDDLAGVSSSQGRGGNGGMGGNFGGRGGGGGRGGMGGASDFQVGAITGITSTKAAGLNYSDKWGKKLEIQSSYFFNQTDNDATQNLLREYVQQVTTDSGRVYQENQRADTRNINHRFNGRFTYTLDTMNSFIFTPRLTVQDNLGNSGLFGETKEGRALLNQTSNKFKSDLLAFTGSADLLWRHKFAKRGRTVSLGVNANQTGNDGESLLMAENLYFNGPATSDTINQRSLLDRTGKGLSGNLDYTEPLGKKGQLNLNYSTSYQITDSDKRTFDFTESSLDYTALNNQLSNIFTSRYITHQAGTGYVQRGEKYDFMVRVGVQQSELDNEQEFPVQANVNRTFRNVLPRAMFGYRFSKTDNLRFFYRTSVNAPSADQLQNVVNNSNPLVLSVGNAGLKQSSQHNVNLQYSLSRPEKSHSFMIMVGGNATRNYIANQTITARRDTVVLGGIALARGTQITQPVNLNGQSRLRSLISYGLPVPIKEYRLNLNFNGSAEYSRNPGLINGRLNFANTQTYGAGVVISSNISENVDFTLSTNSNGVINENSLRPELNSRYLNQTSRARLNWIFWKGLFINSELSHQAYFGLAQGYNNNYTLWNLSVGTKLFADKSGDIRLTAFDLLGQNTSIRRNITESYVEDVQTKVLQRYFMINFSYLIRNFYGNKTTGTPAPEGEQRWNHGTTPGGNQGDRPWERRP